jgi:hypothetical protein
MPCETRYEGAVCTGQNRRLFKERPGKAVGPTGPGVLCMRSLPRPRVCVPGATWLTGDESVLAQTRSGFFGQPYIRGDRRMGVRLPWLFGTQAALGPCSGAGAPMVAGLGSHAHRAAARRSHLRGAVTDLRWALASRARTVSSRRNASRPRLPHRFPPPPASSNIAAVSGRAKPVRPASPANQP